MSLGSPRRLRLAHRVTSWQCTLHHQNLATHATSFSCEEQTWFPQPCTCVRTLGGCVCVCVCVFLCACMSFVLSCLSTQGSQRVNESFDFSRQGPTHKLVPSNISFSCWSPLVLLSRMPATNRENKNQHFFQRVCKLTQEVNNPESPLLRCFHRHLSPES